jgi:hypothetical protein
VCVFERECTLGDTTWRARKQQREPHYVSFVSSPLIDTSVRLKERKSVFEKSVRVTQGEHRGNRGTVDFDSAEGPYCYLETPQCVDEDI